ncbi:MAG: hypothetical protein U1F36_12310 [Planctomycetota bacterium]
MSAVAQDAGAPGPAVASAAAAHSGGRRTVDRVRAIVGDRVILDSSLRRTLAARPEIATADAAQRAGLEESALISIAREELWVQIGKVIGREDPVTFEKRVDELVQDYLREQQDQFGSFARMNQELAALGTSWQTLRDEQRQRILRDTARSYAIGTRFRDSFAMLVTPEEIARFYRDHPEQFAALTSGDIASVSFSKDRKDAAESAGQAAESWKGGNQTSADLATRFGGVALRDQTDVRPGEAKDRRAEFLKQLVSEHEQGAVLGPLDRGETLVVYKLLRKVDQPAASLDEPRVQSAIRMALVNRRVKSLEQTILAFKARQILVWPPEILRR